MCENCIAKAVADRLTNSITLDKVVEVTQMGHDGNIEIKLAANDSLIARINDSMSEVRTIKIEFQDETIELNGFVSTLFTEVGVGPDGAHHFITIQLTLVKRDERHGFARFIASKTK